MREKELVDIARMIIGDDSIELETPIETIDKWDSLAHVMLVAAVFEETGISVPAEQIKEIRCVKDFLKYE